METVQRTGTATRDLRPDSPRGHLGNLVDRPWGVPEIARRCSHAQVQRSERGLSVETIAKQEEVAA